MDIVKNSVKIKLITLLFDPTYDKDKVDLPMISISDFNEVAEELDITETDMYDTNGWQHDFWKTYVDDEGTYYQLSGSWYYGDYVFSRNKNKKYDTDDDLPF